MLNKDKNYARKIAKENLLRLSKEERLVQEDKIIAYLEKNGQWQNAQVIALTKSMPMEFSLEKVVQLARNMNKTIVVPVTFPYRQMKFAFWDDKTEFQKNSFGVEEPIQPVWVEQEQIDLVIVPGLAYSKRILLKFSLIIPKCKLHLSIWQSYWTYNRFIHFSS